MATPGWNEPALTGLQGNVLPRAEVRAGVAGMGVGGRFQVRIQHLQLDLQGGSGGRKFRRFVENGACCGGLISHSHSL